MRAFRHSEAATPPLDATFLLPPPPPRRCRHIHHFSRLLRIYTFTQAVINNQMPLVFSPRRRGRLPQGCSLTAQPAALISQPLPLLGYQMTRLLSHYQRAFPSSFRRFSFSSPSACLGWGQSPRGLPPSGGRHACPLSAPCFGMSPHAPRRHAATATTEAWARPGHARPALSPDTFHFVFFFSGILQVGEMESPRRSLPRQPRD